MGYSAKQKKVRISIEGGEALAKRLKSMGDAAESILKSAAREGGEIALKDAKRRCPVDTGALRDSIKLTDNKSSNTKAEVIIDYDKDLKYGAYVELGARGKAAKPFLRNAVDENINQIDDAITESVADAVGRRM